MQLWIKFAILFCLICKIEGNKKTCLCRFFYLNGIQREQTYIAIGFLTSLYIKALTAIHIFNKILNRFRQLTSPIH